jgi:hypothetical protein
MARLEGQVELPLVRCKRTLTDVPGANGNSAAEKCSVSPARVSHDYDAASFVTSVRGRGAGR